MRSTIYLVRHGITEGNKKGWYYGALDVPLEPEGIAEIKRLAAEGVYPDPEDAQIYTTGMLRTEQTLFNMYGRNIEHDVITELQEYRFGIFEGKTYQELVSIEELRAFREDIEGDFVIPGGESRNMFFDRVTEGWNKLVGYHRLKELSHRHSGLPATSIMVCHGGVIDWIAHRLFGEEDEPRFTWIPDPAHGYRITMKDGEAVDYEKF